MHGLGETRQRSRRQLGHLLGHPLDLVVGRFHESALGGVGYRVHQDQVAETFEEVDSESARVVAGIDNRLDGSEQLRPVVVCEGVDGVVDQRDVGDTEEGQCALVGDAFRRRPGQQLIQDAERITG
ncbi:hypothetical protein WIMU106979_20435 [Williamsia muralis]